MSNKVVGILVFLIGSVLSSSNALAKLEHFAESNTLFTMEGDPIERTDCPYTGVFTPLNTLQSTHKIVLRPENYGPDNYVNLFDSITAPDTLNFTQVHNGGFLSNHGAVAMAIFGWDHIFLSEDTQGPRSSSNTTLLNVFLVPNRWQSQKLRMDWGPFKANTALLKKIGVIEVTFNGCSTQRF